ncbi:MAG: 4-(cytidine 5'-diphospho)-2-C-methyl-D-erythritol kinase [Acidimicrobiales bacterium]
MSVPPPPSPPPSSGGTAPTTERADQVAVRLPARAKLTLSLRVTGVRPDGYHLIDAEMVTLDLQDDVDLLPVGTPVGATRPAADQGNGDGSVGWVPDGGRDLVAAALALSGRRAQVRITKRIPVGGGLGGGSADAAAVLRWAGWRDLQAAAALGADVPFCLVGGRARVRGIGEVVESLPFVPRTLTLQPVPFGCSTPEVYAAWDALGGPIGARGNDLEPAALAVEPRLAAWRDALGDASGETPRLAGSGSTWFVPGAHPGEGRIVVRTVPADAPGDGSGR